MPPPRENALESETDRALLTRVAEGHESALSGLYDRFAPALYVLALRITRDARAAGDILEEVFARLWREREKFRARLPADPVSTWLLRMCRARALAWSGEEPIAEEVATSPGTEPGPAPDADAAFAGLSRLEPGVRHRVAELAVAQLAPLGRRALELLYFKGLPIASIARRLNILSAIVPVLLHDAQAELRDQVSSMLAPPRDPS
jgi:RNA polymerase sigma-70 factor (ECF subfamily)